MKNLLGGSAPTNSIFKSVTMFMLVLLTTFGFVSCEDQSNLDVLPKNEVNLKTDFHKEINPNESLSRCICGLSSDKEIGGCKGIKGECTTFARDSIGGGKSSSGTLQRNSTETEEIGGKSTNVGRSVNKEIGGKGTSSNTIQIALTSKAEIGGRNTTTTGNYSSKEIGGAKDNVIIKRETNRDSSDIGGGGKSTTSTLFNRSAKKVSHEFN
jgi:hypothetical protein